MDASDSFWTSSLAPPAICVSAIGSMLLAGLKNSLGLVAFMVVARFAMRIESGVFAAIAVVAADLDAEGRGTAVPRGRTAP